MSSPPTGYAPAMYHALRGVFCVYKPPGQSMARIVHNIKLHLARDLNAMPCRPVRPLVEFQDTQTDSSLPVVTTVPDLADHPLVIGQRYLEEDFQVKYCGRLERQSSGVIVMAVNSEVLRRIGSAKYLKVYQVRGQLGTATLDFSATGKIMEKSTWHHVTQARLDRVLAGVQAGHQRNMFHAAGVHPQSQEAYELAVSGPLRSTDRDAGPIIYGIRCIQFEPPDFTVEIHTSNENCSYLMRTIHEIGLEAKSTAMCTQLRRIRFGPFTLSHALLRKHWTATDIVNNIEMCKPFVMDRYKLPRTLTSPDNAENKYLPTGQVK